MKINAASNRMFNPIRNVYYRFLVLGMLIMSPALLFAQQELKKDDRVRYAGVGYIKLGFGEVNLQLLTKKQAAKLNHRVSQLQEDYGAVVVFVSLIKEEVQDWEKGYLRSLVDHYLGEDPRAARNYVMLLFGEDDGRNWISYGSDNEPDFTAHTEKLNRLFTSSYRKPKAYRPIRRVLKRLDRIYKRLDAARKQALLHPVLSAKELSDLAWAEMDIASDYSSAVQHLDSAVKLDPSYGEAYKLLGYACLELGNEKAAAAAFEKAWALEADFDTAIGILTLHSLRKETAAVEKWKEQVMQFSPDFEKQVYNIARYASQGFFLSKTAEKTFHELFQQEIQQSKPEKPEEAKAY